MKIMKRLGIIMLLMGIVMIGNAIYLIYDYYTNQEFNIVDCYDRYGNKIIGEKCEDYGKDRISLAVFLIFAGGLMLAVSQIPFGLVEFVD